MTSSSISADVEETVALWIAAGLRSRDVWLLLTGRRVNTKSWAPVKARMIRHELFGDLMPMRPASRLPRRPAAFQCTFDDDDLAALDVGSARPPPYGWQTSVAHWANTHTG